MIFMVFFQNVNFELKLITNECEKSILLPGHYIFAANQSLIKFNFCASDERFKDMELDALSRQHPDDRGQWNRRSTIPL